MATYSWVAHSHETLFWYYKGENESDQKKAEALVSQVKAWAERDTIVPFENVPMDVNYSQKYISAICGNLMSWHAASVISQVTKNQLRIMPIKQIRLRPRRKKNCIEIVWTRPLRKLLTIERNTEEFEEMKFADIKETALEEVKGESRPPSKHCPQHISVVVVLVILIPLYVITGYSYGYVMSCHRRQANVLDKIQRWGFAVAAFLLRYRFCHVAYAR